MRLISTRVKLQKILPWIGAILIVVFFHARRLIHYGILGDDVIRIVDAKTLPLQEQLFRPFSEHVAPGFELLTAILVRSFGNDLNQTAFILNLAALASWLFFLSTMTLWVKKVAGRADMAWMTFILSGISSTCLEVPWWFSAATYSLAAGFIFLVLLAIEYETRHVYLKYIFISFLTALAMSFSALGLLAIFLGFGMATAKDGIGRESIKTGMIIGFSLFGYWLICRIFGGNLVSAAVNNNRSMNDIPLGLAYAFSVPAGTSLPLFLGIDARKVTDSFSMIYGIPLTLILLLVIFLYLKRTRLKYHILILLFIPYLVLYPTRAGLVSTGRWQLADFLYFWTSRYHLFAVVALSMLVAKIYYDLIERLHLLKLTRLTTILVIILFSLLQQRNLMYWSWMMEQPDQRRTLAALNKLHQISQKSGVSSKQLLSVFPPVRRGWNASVLELRPDVFPLVRLVGTREEIIEQSPYLNSNSGEIQNIVKLLQNQLSADEWGWLCEGRLLNLSSLQQGLTMLPLEAREVQIEKAEKVGPEKWQIKDWGGFVEFELRLENANQFLVFQNVNADGPVIFQWSVDQKTWPDYFSAWLETKPADNLPLVENITFSTKDLMMHGESTLLPVKIHIRVRPIKPGTLTIQKIMIFENSNK